jgi:hypothetical protein
MELVLEHATVKIPAEPHVERAGKTSPDVDAIITAVMGHALF